MIEHDFENGAGRGPSGRAAMALAAAVCLAGPVPLTAQIGEPADTAMDAAVEAEPAEPRAILADDYGQWESLGSGRLSPDGRWLAAPIGRVSDEDELRIHSIGSDSVVVIAYGVNAAFSDDGRWVAYSVGMSEDDREKLRKQKKTPESSLGLMDLADGDTVLVAGVSSFSFSDDGRYLAMRRYSTGDAEGEDAHGADLVVRELATGIDVNFGNVGEYAWQDDGRLLAMTVDAADNAGNGVRVWDPRDGAIRVLDSHPSEYRHLGWREDHDDLVVLRVFEDEDREGDGHMVLAWRDVDGRTRSFEFDPREHDEFPAGTRIVEHRRPDFADDGGGVFFGVKAWEPTDEAKEKADAAADSAAADAEGDEGEDAERDSDSSGEEDEDEAGVEVWHSKDAEIIPQQKMSATLDREENHLAVWRFDGNAFIQLGDEGLESVTRVEGDRVAIGVDEATYDGERMFGPSYRDVYVIDTRTGERRKVIERVEYFFGASPEGGYLLYLTDDHYHAYDLGRDRDMNITAELPTVFVDVEDDHTVEQKPPFRFAGWTAGDRDILLYDKYDVWRVRSDGAGGERLTEGRADSVIHRYVRVGWEEGQEAIDPGEPAYYNITGEWSKKNGYAVASRLDRRPERRIWLDARVNRLQKADDADVFVYAAESFADSPDYFAARGGLAPGDRVTGTNPFQDDYLWGRSELIEFENAHGQRLQGALFYPADYEPGTRYPMITYIYEIRSPSVHQYYVPSERSAYNTAVWTSQGYFVFQPDIVYRDRNPGLSAVEALVPAVEAVLETGMVDPERVGLVGHSWGGYQTAFVPTQTDLFAAAVAGAPLTELTSMYLSIYWNFGGTDARIFEISQGRMEVPPWEDWESYRANSPVHHIQRLNTPMLVAFGDEDGAVDWDQGIVFYNAARRAGKDMVMLVYEGENHGLAKKENQIDYHRRINEWFGHYLKGEPAPAWMSTGVPYLDQEKGEAAPAG
jgi:dipeptidyl aminopeptidase/acylaminoacyl peptidase